jgi:hypothetical protein
LAILYGKITSNSRLAGCGKRVLEPLEAAGAELRINNLQIVAVPAKGFSAHHARPGNT